MHSLEHLDSLWNFSDPAASEAAFRRELGGDPQADAQLTTQIARTYGLRGDFDTARTLLAPLAQGLEGRPAVVQALYWLEWGRAHASTAHPSPLSDDQRALARQAYEACLAVSSGLDSLAVDALHMMAVVDPAPEDQEAWTRKALDRAEASSQPAARAWRGALRNNLGYALHLAGKYSEAIEQFQLSRQAYLERSQAAQVRIADWMIAWTLRVMGEADQALAAQLRLEKDCDAAGEPDPYVYDELQTLYTARGNAAEAERYGALAKKARGA